MLKIYKSDKEGKLQEKNAIVSNCWVRLTDPTQEEIQHAANRLGVPLDFFLSPLDKSERSRIQKTEHAILHIIHVPLAAVEGEDGPYRMVPIGIIHTSNALVTICDVDHPILQFTHMHTYMILQLLQRAASYYHSCLADIDQQMIAAEHKLQQSIRNKVVFQLLKLNKSLVLFTKTLKINRHTLHKYSRAVSFKEEDEYIMFDIVIEIEQALDMSEIYHTNLSNLLDGYSAIIENNLNAVLKRLTAFTVIAAIPASVAGIYGMNIPLPYQDNTYNLAILAFIGAAGSVGCGWVFYKLRLF